MAKNLMEFAMEYSAPWTAHDPDAIAATHTEDSVFELHEVSAPAKLVGGRRIQPRALFDPAREPGVVRLAIVAVFGILEGYSGFWRPPCAAACTIAISSSSASESDRCCCMTKDCQVVTAVA